MVSRRGGVYPRLFSFGASNIFYTAAIFTLPRINPVAFYIGSIPAYWYFLMYGAGFATALALGIYRAGKTCAVLRRWEFGLFWVLAIPTVLVGGRLGYVVFYNYGFFAANPEIIPRFWEGGMSLHGGLIGVAIMTLVFGLLFKKPFYQMADFIVPLVPLGFFFSRIGNLINGELWGRPTSVPWAAIFPHPLAGRIPRHPSQIYLALFEGLALFAVLWWYSGKPRPRGAISGMFLLLYGAIRFVLEFFRAPDPHLGFVAFGWMSMGQVLCIPVILWGAALLYRAGGNRKSACLGTRPVQGL